MLFDQSQAYRYQHRMSHFLVHRTEGKSTIVYYNPGKVSKVIVFSSPLCFPNCKYETKKMKESISFAPPGHTAVDKHDAKAEKP
jgi:hypothetical protein